MISSVGKKVAIIPRDWELEALLIFMEVSSSFGGGGGRLSYLSVDIFISHRLSPLRTSAREGISI